MANDYFSVPHLTTKDLIRLFSKISISQTSFYQGVPCWEWTGQISPQGYGMAWWNPAKTTAHRIFYAWLCGALPCGRGNADIDHLCRNRRCVNPVHLELVTRQVNLLRGVGFPATNAQKPVCKYGHPFTVRPSGGRYCKTCTNLSQNRRYATNPVYRHNARENAKKQRKKANQT